MGKTELVLVRHGQTAANADNIIQGQRDVPLDELGIKQARATADALAGEHFDAVYASDLSRAVETASIIAPGAAVNATPALREWNLGLWQGNTLADVRKKYPLELEAFYREDDLKPSGGESRSEVVARVRAFLDELPGRCPDSKILLVAHCGSLRVAFHCLMGLENKFPRAPQLSNGSVSRFLFENGVWQLVSWNVTTHLAGFVSLGGRY